MSCWGVTTLKCPSPELIRRRLLDTCSEEPPHPEPAVCETLADWRELQRDCSDNYQQLSPLQTWTALCLKKKRKKEQPTTFSNTHTTQEMICLRCFHKIKHIWNKEKQVKKHHTPQSRNSAKWSVIQELTWEIVAGGPNALLQLWFPSFIFVSEIDLFHYFFLLFYFVFVFISAYLKMKWWKKTVRQLNKAIMFFIWIYRNELHLDVNALNVMNKHHGCDWLLMSLQMKVPGCFSSTRSDVRGHHGHCECECKCDGCDIRGECEDLPEYNKWDESDKNELVPIYYRAIFQRWPTSLHSLNNKLTKLEKAFFRFVRIVLTLWCQ